MPKKTTGIFCYPWPAGMTEGGPAPKSPAAAYRKVLWLKANPRDAKYMEELFLSRYPNGEFIDADKILNWKEKLTVAEDVVVLFPDATGIGFRRIETSAIKSGRVRGFPVRILNGRKREFELTPAVIRKLRFRRFMEKTMLAELAASIAFIIATPFLMIFDLSHGRK